MPGRRSRKQGRNTEVVDTSPSLDIGYRPLNNRWRARFDPRLVGEEMLQTPYEYARPNVFIQLVRPGRVNKLPLAESAAGTQLRNDRQHYAAWYKQDIDLAVARKGWFDLQTDIVRTLKFDPHDLATYTVAIMSMVAKIHAVKSWTALPSAGLDWGDLGEVPRAVRSLFVETFKSNANDVIDSKWIDSRAALSIVEEELMDYPIPPLALKEALSISGIYKSGPLPDDPIIAYCPSNELTFDNLSETNPDRGSRVTPSTPFAGPSNVTQIPITVDTIVSEWAQIYDNFKMTQIAATIAQAHSDWNTVIPDQVTIGYDPKFMDHWENNGVVFSDAAANEASTGTSDAFIRRTRIIPNAANDDQSERYDLPLDLPSGNFDLDTAVRFTHGLGRNISDVAGLQFANWSGAITGVFSNITFASGADTGASNILPLLTFANALPTQNPQRWGVTAILDPGSGVMVDAAYRRARLGWKRVIAFENDTGNDAVEGIRKSNFTEGVRELVNISRMRELTERYYRSMW